MDKMKEPSKIQQQQEQPSQQELINFCEERMQWTIRMYPEHLRPSLETQAEYTAEWLDIVQQIGSSRFSEGLRQAVHDSDFFPVVAKIRRCCGLTREQQEMAGAGAAWLLVQDHIRKWGSHGMPVFHAGGKQTKPPALPDRIAYALRLIGGLGAVEYCADSSLPFMRKEFMAAWQAYPESSAAYIALRLDMLPPKLLNSGERVPDIPEPKEIAIPKRVVKSIPAEMTDAEWEDRKEILRQQAETIKRRMAKEDAHHPGMCRMADKQEQDTAKEGK